MTDTLRRIDLGGRARTRGRKLVRPKLAWLAIDTLRLDDSYQRGLAAANWANISTIAANFDWARFTPILAAPVEGGLYAIIDGQHRTHAAALRGFDEVPAMVAPMTHAEQARAFAWVNGQVTAITMYHVYKAALAAMEPWALDARDAVEAAGCRLMTYNVAPHNRKPREVYLIALVREHVDAGRADLVTAVLAAISAAPTGDEPHAWSNAVVRPFLAALLQLSDWRQVDLARFLAENDLVDIHDRVAVMRRQQPGLARQPPSLIYRRTLLALLRKHVGEAGKAGNGRDAA